jgi:hypothetical protein
MCVAAVCDFKKFPKFSENAYYSRESVVKGFITSQIFSTRKNIIFPMQLHLKIDFKITVSWSVV